MIALRSFARRGNPLDRMTYSGNGLHPLPVEMWQRILSYAVDLYQYQEEEHHGFFFSQKVEALLHDPSDEQIGTLIRRRLSIVLVCRSWYFMGIPILWSHLQIGQDNPKDVATHIHKRIKQNPSLASHITQFSILPHTPTPTSRNLIPVVGKILPLLSNLQVIACPLDFSLHLPASLQLKMILLEGSGEYFSTLSQPSTPLWHTCQTLSLTFGEAEWNDLPEHPQLTFNNLINLRLRISNAGAAEWIQSSWNTPVLRNLSFMPIAGTPWIEFLKRNRLNLQTAQLPGYWASSPGSILMPKLRELHLVDLELYYAEPQQAYDNVIQADELRKCVFYIEADLRGLPNYRTNLIRHIDIVLSLYSTIKEIAIVAREEQWIDPHRTQDQIPVTKDDITSWCARGLVVEMITGMGKVSRYRQELSAEEDSVPPKAEAGVGPSDVSEPGVIGCIETGHQSSDTSM